MRDITNPFLVPILADRGGLPSSEYLYVDGTTGSDADKAVRFRSYTSATMLERQRIERYTHEYAGGLREFLDLQKGCEATRLAVVKQASDSLWPDGRPTAAGEELAAQDKALEGAWAALESLEKDGYHTMRAMVDRVVFLATWRVLVVSPPAGWESLADRPGLDEAVFYTIWNAWLAATEAARAGK